MKWILDGMGWEVVDWIHLAKDRDHWRALLNMAMKVLVSKNQGEKFPYTQPTFVIFIIKLILYLLHVSVVRPSSSKKYIYTHTSEINTTDNGSVFYIN
jgi:hypothetical protein